MNATGCGHYVKGSGRGSLPGRLVVVVTRPAAAGPSARTAEGSPGHTPRIVSARCHRHRDGYSRPVLTEHPSPADLWDWLEGPRSSGQRAYLFSPVASETLTHLGFWSRLEVCGCRWSGQASAGNPRSCRPDQPTPYTIRKWALYGSPDILDYSRGPTSFRWTSVSNYLRECEREVAASCGYQWKTAAEGDDSDRVVSADAADHAAMWCHAITTLMLWWRDRAAGRFPLTIAGMGYAFLRSRLAPKAICTHTHEDVIGIERKSCHGGRATLWYVGDVRPRGRHTKPDALDYPSGGDAAIAGPIHHVDIKSMYPSIMRDETFPVKYYKSEQDISPDRLSQMLDLYHACARVSLDTERAEYPYRTGNRVLYPTGRFTTHLTTPELRIALADGAVTRVHDVALYYRGRPFQRAAVELLDMREQAERIGNKAFATWCKLLANSSTGKLAQRTYQWVPCKDKFSPDEWGAWYDLDAKTGEVTQYKTLAGLVWRRTNEEGGIGTTTAAYATLTAYGRVMMRMIRESLPYRTVISQDTDGLWITNDGLLHLSQATLPSEDRVGSLRLQLTVTSARFWTAQHYTAGGSWTLSGFASPERVSGTTSFRTVEAFSPIRGAPYSAPTEVTYREEVKSLDSISADGIYADDGWMTPYRLPGVLPTRIQPRGPDHELF